MKLVFRVVVGLLAFIGLVFVAEVVVWVFFL